MSRLCIVTALPAETRPLLDVLKLRQIKARHLRLYGADQYLLLETGPGKLNTAAGVGALLQAYSEIDIVVNIGIAGGTFDYATVLAAHHVQDVASGAQWFPHLPDNKSFKNIQSAVVNTLDAPNTQYRDGILFDMEAAGIFSAGSRYLSTSQIHSFKIVSDNPDHDIRDISKKSVVALITQALPSLLPLLETLQDLDITPDHGKDALTDALIAETSTRTHHSVNDEQLLRQLVQRYLVLTGNLPTIDKQAVSAKDVRLALQKALDEQPFVYG
ncbi:MAG: hypothetical protein AB8B87_03485 [Granulosicoccus sp.]